MTQLIEGTKEQEDRRTEEGPGQKVSPFICGHRTGGRQIDPAADAWKISNPAGRV